MDAARWQAVNELFHAVITRAPDDQRAWLERECHGDRTLVEDVDRLIQAHARAASNFLTGPRLSDATASVRGAPIGLDFRGTDRFDVRHLLGVGGMGVVYEVYDRERDETVALKTLLRVTPAEMYRLKQEFRRLTDVAHPNLVTLHELFVDGELCFLTMERVNGVAFGQYVQGPEEWGPNEPREAFAADRARHVFPQLVEAISELHRRGMLHRDVKPSNVLVTGEGRVVVLDFGLIADISTRGLREQLAGTPAYMAPEQLLGAALSQASDWYSVGATLYEALTGRLPFSGTFSEIVRLKTTVDPPPPATIARHVPEDLSAVCAGLLCRDPLVRMSGPAAVATLERGSAVDAAAAAPAEAVRESLFVGRQLELEMLNDAFERTRTGRLALMFVSGPSGIGKTALVRWFLDRLARRGDVVLLSGRCYENESVPYKALDGIVDSLSRYLMSLSGDAVARLMPPDAPALGRLFPVLKRVAGVTGADRLAQEIVDPQVFRRRAFAALRQLLTSIAAQQPLVIFVDDLHWADADSAQLFADLLRPPDAPAALAIVCCRSEELPSKPFLQSLLEQAGIEAAITLPIGPMTNEEAHDLVTSLVPPDSLLTLDERQQIALEADGSPFFLDQLARHASAHSMMPGRGPTLAEMIELRLQQLTPGARSFLRTLAICGRPVARSLVREACGLTSDERPLVALLRSTHLVRSSGSADHVEIYHDRIREAIVAQLEPKTVEAVHTAMAMTLVSRHIDDPDALVEHYSGAGDRGSAATYAVRAAEKASAVLAFDRAASLYQRALELSPEAEGPAGRSARSAWREGLALALANAGRPAEAAEAYLLAASGVERARLVELQQRAAEQFLTGGHIDRGLDLMRRVLESVGLSSAGGPRRTLLSLIWRRARLRVRGLQFVPRQASDIDPDVLRRLDATWAAATGLLLVVPLSAFNFVVQHLHMALDAGEPSRIARGAALEWAARHADWHYRVGSARLLPVASLLAKNIGTPYATAMMALADGLAAITVGEWKRSLTSSERAVPILRDQCVGVTWELDVAQNGLIWALMYLGEIGEVCRRVPALLADARRRGNLLLATELCTRSNYVWLAADNPEAGVSEAMDAIASWSHKGFHRQHYNAMLVQVQTALYRGDGWAGWQLLAEHESKLRRSMLRRVQLLRIEMQYLRGRCAIAIASANASERRFLSVARACARRIARERMPWSDPIALLLRAGIAAVERQPNAARTFLEDAAGRFGRADMQLYVAVTRRRLGLLVGGERGSQMLRQTDEWMMSQTIRNPARLTRMLAPGFPDEPGL